MDFDSVLQQVGQFGLFQKYLIFLVALPICMSCWQSLLHAFVGFIPRHRCWIDNCDNFTSKYDEQWVNYSIPYETHDGVRELSSCKQYINHGNSSDPEYCTSDTYMNRTIIACNTWKFDDNEYKSTIATEWNLYCHDEYLVSLAGSVNMAGGLIGCIILGNLADRWGRKPTMLLCLALISVFGVGAALSPNISCFMVMRFLVESVESSNYQILFVLVMEFIGPDKRVLVCQIIQLIYSLAEVSLAGIAYLIPEWSLLQLVTAAPAFLFLIYHWFLPESARWLIANGRRRDADVIIQKVADWNHTKVAREMSTSSYGTESFHTNGNVYLENGNDSQQLIGDKSRLNTLDLFRSVKLRKWTIILMLNWFLNVVVYVGITFNSTKLGGDDAILTFFLTAVVEIPANLLSILLMSKMGRRSSLSISFLFTGAALVAMKFVPATDEYFWLSVLLTVMGKFGSTIGNAALYLISTEIFPTVLRNNGTGLCGLMSNLASTVAPQLTLLGTFDESLPYVVLGVGSLVGGLSAFILPETLGKRLPETVEDAENLGR